MQTPRPAAAERRDSTALGQADEVPARTGDRARQYPHSRRVQLLFSLGHDEVGGAPRWLVAPDPYSAVVAPAWSSSRLYTHTLPGDSGDNSGYWNLPRISAGYNNNNNTEYHGSSIHPSIQRPREGKQGGGKGKGGKGGC